MPRYWRVVQQEITAHGLCPNKYYVSGAAEEVVALETRRLMPLEELEAIAEALNHLPAYHVATP
jgi:hypothetical protein